MAAVDLAAVVLGDTNIKPKDLISEIVQEHTADDFFLATGPQGDDVCVLFGFGQERAIDTLVRKGLEVFPVDGAGRATSRRKRLVRS